MTFSLFFVVSAALVVGCSEERTGKPAGSNLNFQNSGDRPAFLVIQMKEEGSRRHRKEETSTSRDGVPRSNDGLARSPPSLMTGLRGLSRIFVGKLSRNSPLVRLI
jgi:hypothetical protein